MVDEVYRIRIANILANSVYLGYVGGSSKGSGDDDTYFTHPKYQPQKPLLP